MIGDLLCLTLFVLAILTGVARSRSRPYWDAVSLLLSDTANFAGTFLLAAFAFNNRDAASLVPLSLLILMHGSALFYRSQFPRIIGLPLVIGELLMMLQFPSIRTLFMNPLVLLIATFFHIAFIGFMFRLLLKLKPLERRQPSWSPYSLAVKLRKHRHTHIWPGRKEAGSH